MDVHLFFPGVSPIVGAQDRSQKTDFTKSKNDIR